MESGEQARFLDHLRRSYAARAQVMDESLREHIGRRARWVKPEGGYFFWLAFEQGFDATEIRARAADHRTGFQPGANSSAAGGLGHCMRLSFAHYTENEIREGVGRLARLIEGELP
jgi:DNA-binding transcriptional MocR family regulator